MGEFGGSRLAVPFRPSVGRLTERAAPGSKQASTTSSQSILLHSLHPSHASSPHYCTLHPARVLAASSIIKHTLATSTSGETRRLPAIHRPRPASLSLSSPSIAVAVAITPHHPAAIQSDSDRSFVPRSTCTSKSSSPHSDRDMAYFWSVDAEAGPSRPPATKRRKRRNPAYNAGSALPLALPFLASAHASPLETPTPARRYPPPRITLAPRHGEEENPDSPLVYLTSVSAPTHLPTTTVTLDETVLPYVLTKGDDGKWRRVNNAWSLYGREAGVSRTRHFHDESVC